VRPSCLRYACRVLFSLVTSGYVPSVDRMLAFISL
jgi:hypothetical protein